MKINVPESEHQHFWAESPACHEEFWGHSASNPRQARELRHSSTSNTMKAVRNANMVWSGYDTFDWSGCDEVEQVEGKVSGVPILKHTRMQADLVADNYQAGLSVEEIADTYGLDPRQVKAVIDYSLNH
jgi:uncharacterized protein (DUF433 family)